MTETRREEEVYRAAHAIFNRNPDWVTFFREVLGLNGVVRRHFTSREALSAFEKTETHAKLQQMLGKLREQTAEVPAPQEETRVITVRLPKSLHDALRAEAHEYHTSMNKLCISKLLQYIDIELVPTDS
jgi:predicted HicB family RNase H-like nuclease